MKKQIFLILAILFFINILGCKNNSETEVELNQKKIEELAVVQLNHDLIKFSDNDKKVIKLLISASQYIDTIFLYENIGYFDTAFQNFPDELTKKLFEINFGPWDRINGNIPFIKNVGNKPLGANFYPIDITKEEFEKFGDSLKLSSFTFVRRDSAGNLKVNKYHEVLHNKVEKIAEILNQAAELTENVDFKQYLKYKAIALQTDQ